MCSHYPESTQVEQPPLEEQETGMNKVCFFLKIQKKARRQRWVGADREEHKKIIYIYKEVEEEKSWYSVLAVGEKKHNCNPALTALLW